MRKKDKAALLIKEKGFAHVIYGYRLKGKDIMISERCFEDDDSYIAYIDSMQSVMPNLEMIYASHK